MIEQVVLRAGFEEAQHLGFGVKEQDGFVVTEKGLPLGTVLAPLRSPEGIEITLRKGELDGYNRAGVHGQTVYPVGLQNPLKAIPMLFVRSGLVCTGLPASTICPPPEYMATCPSHTMRSPGCSSSALT